MAVPPDDLIEDALNALRPDLRGRRVSVHIAPDLPLVAVDVEAATDQIRRAVNDTIGSAPGDAGITIGATVWKGTVEVRVAGANGDARVLRFPEASLR